jgi:hypothetical protein
MIAHIVGFSAGKVVGSVDMEEPKEAEAMAGRPTSDQYQQMLSSTQLTYFTASLECILGHEQRSI